VGIQSWNIESGEQTGGVSPHALTHHVGGTDEISAEAIGARSVDIPINYLELAGIPEEFWPKSHLHLWGEVLNRPTAFNPALHGSRHAIGGVDYHEPIGFLSDLNFSNVAISNKVDTGSYQVHYSLANSASFGLPFNSDWVYLTVIRHLNNSSYYCWQTVCNLRDAGTGNVPFQIWTRLVFNGTARPWEKLLHRDSGRLNFALASGWSNFSATTYLPSYRKHGESIKLSGLVGRASSDLLVTTLPAGFRPFSRVIFTTQALAPGLSTSTLARVDVDVNGQVIASAPTPAGPLTWLSLDGISFFAA
jgi:hypothetical protein